MIVGLVFGTSFSADRCAELARIRRAFAWRLEHDGYVPAVEEFLAAECLALGCADSYAEWRARQHIYHLVWLADVVRH